MFNGRDFHLDKYYYNEIVEGAEDFSEKFKFVKGDEVLPIEYVASFSKHRDEELYKLVDGMRVYTEIKGIHVLKREDIENQNVQVRLAGEDGWVYFDIER